jgi:hypothetical protein
MLGMMTGESQLLIYPSSLLITQQAKQGACEILQKKSTANVNEENEIKMSDLKKQHKAAIKALKETHKKEVKDLQKKVQAWEKGVSPFLLFHIY